MNGQEPSLHFEKPDPKIALEATPFYVASELSEWRSGSGPRRAGVSSLGIGGNNAHVILEKAPRREPRPAQERLELPLIAARSEGALERVTRNLAAHLRENPAIQLADVAHTQNLGRSAQRRGWGPGALIEERGAN